MSSAVFTRDELIDLEDSVINLINDKNDYCANEEGTAEQIARLQVLLDKVQGMLNDATPQTCEACGTETPSVVGCPDGAEICRQCFEMGAH